jgi:serpin B
MNKLLASLTIMGIVMAGCSSDEPNTDDPVQQLAKIELNSSETVENEALNVFALDLFAKATAIPEMQSKDGNCVISPLSASMALGLMANAADDASSTQIANMMGISNLNSLNSTCSKLLEYLPDESNGATMIIANSAWMNSIFSFKNDFIASISESYNAETFNIDFSRSDIAELMNQWCSKNTKGLINNAVQDVKQSTPMCLLNALYFEGLWKTPFNKNLTKDAVFHGTSGDKSVKMMHNTDGYKYYLMDDCSGVCVPFKNATTEMLFVLPDSDVDIETLAASFDSKKFAKMLESSPGTPSVSLYVPKFKIADRTSLNKVLHQCGLDLGKVTMDKAVSAATEGSSMGQSVYIEVNEEGAKLAAVTDRSPSASIGLSFVIDRPFLFFVRNNVTGTILMAGCVRNI